MIQIFAQAKRWDDKQVSTLKSRKEKLTDELRQAMKNSRKESEIQTIQSQISGLKTRLKYSMTDRDNTKKKIAQLEKMMDKMREDLEEFEPKVSEIEQVMKDREVQIEDTKEKMNSVEDKIFGSFCKSIGVSNIRQYEERELKTQQDREKKKLEFENQINRITTQLEYEQKREDQLQENVTKFERMVQVCSERCFIIYMLLLRTFAVKDVEDQLEASKKAESVTMGEIDKEMRSVPCYNIVDSLLISTFQGD